MSRELRVYLDGVAAGTITQTPQGALGFRYDETYAAADRPTPLSLSMPLDRSRHPNKNVRAWLEGLLPDNQDVRERWGRQYGVSANSAFGLLRHVGRDAAGAVQVLPPDASASDAAQRRGDVEWLADEEVISMLRDLALHGADWNPGRRAGRWSLAGAQAKLALYRDPKSGSWGIPRDSTPTTHILKPTTRGLDDHHVNELLCLRAARRLGLPAAGVDMIESGDVQALVSVRYDRVVDGTGTYRRLHQEDLCQALSVHPTLKYQSDGGPGVGAIGDLFARLPMVDRDITRRQFLDDLAYNVAIGGTDAHAKNFSLLLAGSHVRLAPLYDVSSASPYVFDTAPASAMRVGDHWVMRQITESDWAKTARRLALDPDESVDRVRSLRARVPDAFGAAADELPGSIRDRALGIASAIARHASALPSAWGRTRSATPPGPAGGQPGQQAGSLGGRQDAEQPHLDPGQQGR